MTQPPNTTPGEWKQRTDVNTRIVIDRMNESVGAMKKDIVATLIAQMDAAIADKTRGFVTWPGIAGSIVALLSLVAVLVFSLVAPVKDAANQTRQDAKDARKEEAEANKEFRTSVQAKVEKIDARVEGMWRNQFEGKPKSEVVNEVKQRTEKTDRTDKNGRLDSNPRKPNQ